jgi:hypothetical protein
MRAQVRFEAWQHEIDHAADIDQLLQAVRAYLAAWPAEALALLPIDLAATALPDTDAIYARAFLASRAELAHTGQEPGYPLLRELALTLAAAAARLRTLESYRRVAHIGTRNVDSVLPRGPRGLLEAEVKSEA